MDGQQSRQQGEFSHLILPSLQRHEAQEHSSRRDLTYTSSASSLYRRNHLAQPDYLTEMGLQSNRIYHSDSEGSFADAHFSYEPGCLASAVARWPLQQVTGHIPNNERTRQCLPHEHLDCTGYTHNLIAERVVDTHGSTNFDQAPASQSHHTVYTADTRSEMMSPWNTGLSSLQHPLTTPTTEELQRGTLPRADEIFHGQQVLMPPCPQTSSFTDQPFHFFDDLAQQDPLYPLNQYIHLPSEEEQGTSQIYEDTFQNNQPGQAQLRLPFLQDCAYGNPSGPPHQGLNLPLSRTATSAVDDDLQTQFDTLIAGNLLPPDVPQGLILPVLPSLNRSEFFCNQTSNPGASKPQDGHNERGWLAALNKAAHGFSALLFNTNNLRRGPSGTACVRCSFDRVRCFTPPDRAGACHNCYELGLEVLYCRPRMIRDLKTFDKWLEPEYRRRLIEIDIGSIIAHSDRKTSLTHYPDGPFIQVICRKFISTDDLQILVHRRNGKEMCSRKTTPWLLAETPDIKRYVSDCVLYLFREFEGDKRPIADLLRLARDVFCSTHEPLLYAIFQMLTILRLLRLGWQFSPRTSETLDMIVGNHENSPWDGRNPIPRMISNQLTVTLEERMISIDNWVTKRFDEILTKRVRLSWIVVLMSTFVYAHVRELDAGRNIHWSRHPESQRFWSHPKKPAELLGKGVVDCNVMLSQVYTVCKPEKDFESWDDGYRRNLAESHQKLQTMVEKLQCLVTTHRHEGWIGREGKQEYVEGDSSSVSYTMSSLVFCTPDRNPVVDNFK